MSGLALLPMINLNLRLTIVLAAILLVKRCFARSIHPRAQRWIGTMILFLLLLPFLPRGGMGVAPAILQLSNGFAKAGTALSFGGDAQGNGFFTGEFAVSVQRLPKELPVFLWCLWGAGFVCCFGYFLLGRWHIQRLLKGAASVRDSSVQNLLASCQKKAGLQRKIEVLSSTQIKNPMTFGILRPRIVLPNDWNLRYSTIELRHIFLHELQHRRQGDLLRNELLLLMQAVYWYHPLVWYAFRAMRADQELACDAAVMRLLGINESLEYGRTILKHAGRIQPQSIGSFYFGATLRRTKRRVQAVADFCSGGAPSIRKNLLCVSLAALLGLLSCPFLVSTAYGAKSSAVLPPEQQLEQIDLSEYFGNLAGSFVLYDPAAQRYQIYRPEEAVQRVAPNSTYKIYSALFALDSGTITPGQTKRAWNGRSYPFDTWEADQTLDSAMKNSVNWYFQSLDQSLGSKSLNQYLKRIGYGNCDMSGSISEFWLESSLKISPLEQAVLLHQLFQNAWSLNPEAVAAVKDALLLSDTEGLRLSGKTGTGKINGTEQNGWFVGSIEQNGQTRFFALYLRGEGADGSRAAQIAVEYLSGQGNLVDEG